MGQKRPWYDRPYSPANRTNKPTAPRLNVIEGGKEITPSEPTTKYKRGITFLGNTYRQVVGLGRKANVFAQVLEPTPLSDGTIPLGWKPPSPQAFLEPQDIKIGDLDIKILSPYAQPKRVKVEDVQLPPLPPTYISRMPIVVSPYVSVDEYEAELTYQPPGTLGLPPPQNEFVRGRIISLDDVHIGNPFMEVNNQVRRYSNAFGDKRWLGQADVIITSTDYKPYDQGAAIEEYNRWLAEQNRIISDLDVKLQPRVLADSRVVNMIDEIYYTETKLETLTKPDLKADLEKFTELSVELLTETKLAVNTRQNVRAGSNTKKRRDGKSRYGEAYLALKRVIDATIGGELPELYFMFTDNLISKPLGRQRPPMRKGYLSFWDPRSQQWRYKAKTPYGIYEGYQTGFLELDVESFIVDVAYNFVEDALIGKMSRMGKRGHDSMLQQFGKTGREIGFQFGPTL